MTFRRQQSQFRFIYLSVVFLLIFILSGCDLNNDTSGTSSPDPQTQDGAENQPSNGDNDTTSPDPQTQDGADNQPSNGDNDTTSTDPQTQDGNDNHPPSIISRSPQPDQSGVSTTAEISVRFDEALLVNSVDSQSILLSQNGSQVPGVVSYDSVKNTINHKPSSPLSPDTTYTVTLAKTLKDLSDNAFAGENWSFSTAAETVADKVCDTAEEGKILMLSCPAGQVIKEVNFASYGSPGGSCGSFTTGSCNASKSVAVVSDTCTGKSSCTLNADNNTFGDPCYGTVKKLAAQVACAMASDTTPEPTPEPTSIPNSNSDCPVELVGFASLNTDGQNGTTGGGNAAPTTVRTLSELKSAAGDSSPRVIIVSGTIDTGGSAVSIASNKTLIGADKNATIKGGIDMKGVSNIIIRNLNFQGNHSGSSPADTIASRDSHHIWYDHLDVRDAGDGLLDITIKSSYQTVSWSKFWYSNKNDDHRLASLNGSGGGTMPWDWGKLKITYHHNWWGDLVDQRMPRVMYGQGHEFNNYFNSPGNSYCIGVGSYGSVLIEDNYFKDVRNPHQFMYDVYMYAAASGNIYDNTTGTRDTGLGGNRDETGHTHMTAEAFTPPYRYTLDAAKDVPDIVKRCAGPQ